jgi:hypothetical protein
MSYSYTEQYVNTSDVDAVADQLAQRQSDVGTTNGGISGTPMVPQLGVDPANLGISYLKATADVMMTSVAFQGQDDQAASGGSVVASSFTAAAYPTWSFSAPFAKNYLVHVDLSAQMSAFASTQRMFFQLRVNGVAPSGQPAHAMTIAFNSTNYHQRLSFRVLAPFNAGANTIALYWSVDSGCTGFSDSLDYRCFTVSG